MRPIRAILDLAARALRGGGPIADGTALERFLASRAAHAAQAALYGYLKARMGTRFREYFEDDAFAAAIRTARTEVFVASLGDLVLCAMAMTEHRDAAYAEARFAAALRWAFDEAGEGADPAPYVEKFATRAKACGAESPPFAHAAETLVTHAPVIDTFMALDREAVENAITLRLTNVRDDLARRMDRAAISAEIRAGL